MKPKHKTLLIIYLLAIIIISLMVSCTKESPVKCYKCYVNWVTPKKYAYDTCVIEGQRAWRDDGFNCYLK